MKFSLFYLLLLSYKVHFVQTSFSKYSVKGAQVSSWNAQKSIMVTETSGLDIL